MVRTRHPLESEWKSFYPTLSKLAKRLCFPNLEAEDILQETAIRAFKTFDSSKGKNLRAWLTVIMKSCYVDELRKFQRRLNGRHAYTNDYDDMSIPPDAQELAVLCREMDALLSSLSEIHRRVLLLYAEGFDCDEIAKILGIPVGTTKSRLHYARRKLHAYRA